MGDSVFYKRDGCNEWRDPGKIIGQDGKIVVIRHGNNCVKVHISRVLGTTYEIGSINTTVEKNDTTSGNNVGCSSRSHHVEDSESEDEQNDVRDIGHQNTAVSVTQLPKTGQKVKYLPVDESHWRVTTVLGRAEKATGRYRY